MRKALLVCLMVCMSSVNADEVLSTWNGFSITPGAGLRHLGLDVIRKSDNFTGNIAQEVGGLENISPRPVLAMHSRGFIKDVPSENRC